MAQVHSFWGWRYSSSLAGEDHDISTLVSPPYDVLSTEERDALAAIDPRNVVELELAHGPQTLEEEGNRYERAAETWLDWVAEGVLEQDEDPAIYVLEQRFALDGEEHARICFICEMDLHAFDEKVVIPHELTLPKALGDRYRLLSTMNVNTSQVFGIYSDPTPGYEEMLAEVRACEPVARASEIAAGGIEVASTLWAMSDPAFVARFAQTLAGKQVFIADGHHRYTVALAWRDKCREEGFENPGSERVMIALSNMDDPQLLILAYHRAVKAEGAFDADAFLAALAERFDLAEGPADPAALQAAVAQTDPAVPAFAVMLAGRAPVIATLRADVDLDEAIAADHSHAWKALDVSVLHEIVIKPLFGVDPLVAETLSRIAYSSDAATIAARLGDGSSDAVFIMRPTRMDQIQDVSLGGETMPQKSTYFFPKLPSGMVFREL